MKQKGTDCDEMKQLKKANLHFVVALTFQCQNRRLPIVELLEAGKAGLKKAVQNYDLDSDFKFITHEVTQMRQSIEGLITQNCAKKEKGGIQRGDKVLVRIISRLILVTYNSILWSWRFYRMKSLT